MRQRGGSQIRPLPPIMGNPPSMLTAKETAILQTRIKTWWPTISMRLQVNKKENIRKFMTQQSKPVSRRPMACVSRIFLRPNKLILKISLKHPWRVKKSSQKLSKNSKNHWPKRDRFLLRFLSRKWLLMGSKSIKKTLRKNKDWRSKRGRRRSKHFKWWKSKRARSRRCPKST